MMRKVLATAATVILTAAAGMSAVAAEPVVLAPTPIVDTPLAAMSGQEIAVVSGGCFWGMQAVFQHVKGVHAAISGYTGGGAETANYQAVSAGDTGHAESLEITFDPHVISFGTLLRIYFSVATNPTELNYQGPDEGNQYRGDIWAESAQQRQIAEAYIRQLTAAHTFPSPIVTRIDTAKPFYPAEDYHQNFATLHPDNPYIAINDAPKVKALAKLFPDLYLAQPTLVGAGMASVAQGR